MQQTRTQSLVSRERERARECEARRGGARGILGSLRLDPQSRALSLFLLPSDWVRVWEYSERGTEQKKGGRRIASANCMK